MADSRNQRTQVVYGQLLIFVVIGATRNVACSENSSRRAAKTQRTAIFIDYGCAPSCTTDVKIAGVGRTGSPTSIFIADCAQSGMKTKLKIERG